MHTDTATISVGDLGTNLSRLGIYRKHPKKDAQAQPSAKSLAKMFPTMAQPASWKPSADRATQAADSVITGRAATQRPNRVDPVEVDPKQREVRSALSDY